MKLEQQVVSLELAKKLKELGVEQESLFYWCNHVQLGNLKSRQCSDYLIYGHQGWHERTRVSAFTVAELGEMLPAGALGAYLNIFKNVDKGWNVGYGLEVTLEADTEADARAKMLIYLLENNLIKNV